MRQASTTSKGFVCHLGPVRPLDVFWHSDSLVRFGAQACKPVNKKLESPRHTRKWTVVVLRHRCASIASLTLRFFSARLTLVVCTSTKELLWWSSRCVCCWRQGHRRPRALASEYHVTSTGIQKDVVFSLRSCFARASGVKTLHTYQLTPSRCS